MMELRLKIMQTLCQTVETHSGIVCGLHAWVFLLLE